MEKLPENREPDTTIAGNDDTWVKPELVSFLPAKAAEGISYRPTDGISNLTP
ncbi:hypothetical protein OF829_05335 [Sphingomonas sp. LB-2]|uniref:hypothetical protein n=1 Tax=Sphingomonas caeni TaxID=2984949 RepID=UPI002231E6B5|nr:hypothetical protein [Sphingomonas caeni]MCW3846653.1 hypothetical protein [Sphingomonas caeni]